MKLEHKKVIEVTNLTKLQVDVISSLSMEFTDDDDRTILILADLVISELKGRIFVKFFTKSELKTATVMLSKLKKFEKKDYYLHFIFQKKYLSFNCPA
jgi:hypothetical protein